MALSLSSLLQMGANNSSLTPLNCILKNGDRFDPQSLQKTRLIFLCDTAQPQYPLEDSKRWLAGGSLNYNAVLQLGRFCWRQGKRVEVACVLPFFSLRGMSDLCPQGVDLGRDLQLPPALLLCPRTRGSRLSKLKVREPPGRVASVSEKTQTEVQTAQVEVQIWFQ